ncbi:integral membrane protein [Teratosphaeria destructans]|uniref:Integral membrane protein n=1 Tax=Teratosphaeria destructans TaxID=418781 RepID=A0A9W7W6T9_9PEZI|nr:integral membrane protein [Teratosphaeria destructans]
MRTSGLLGALVSPHSLCFFIFILSYLLIIQQLEEKARIRQAEALVRELQENPEVGRHDTVVMPSICMGIITTGRDSDGRGFRNTVASILHGLTASERKELRLVALFADTDPEEHAVYHEPWTDEVFEHKATYDNVPSSTREQLADLEDQGQWDQKALLDYIFMLETCHATNAQWAAIIEDDIIAAEGWFTRLRYNLWDWAQAEKLFKRSVFMRLFYTESTFNWDPWHEWPSYLFWLAVFETLLYSAMWILCHNSIGASRFFTRRTKFVILFFCAPACVVLYIIAGRITVAAPQRGMHYINKHGCCTQAILYPKHRIQGLIDFLKSKDGFDGDSRARNALLEEYADMHSYDRWTLTPPLFQHAGFTREDIDDGREPGEWRLPKQKADWNFDFELQNGETLRKEHEAKINEEALRYANEGGKSEAAPPRTEASGREEDDRR